MHRVLLLSALPLIACAPELDACESLVLRECDVGDAACADHYNALIRCIRGDDQPTPKLEKITLGEYNARFPDVPPSPPTADEQLVDRGLGLLHFGALTPRDEPSSALAATYDYSTQTVLVLDASDTREVLRALSEAHADAARGDFLNDLTITSEDQYSAVLALYFGEVLFYGDAAWRKTEALSHDDFAAYLARYHSYSDDKTNAAAIARFWPYTASETSAAFIFGYGPHAAFGAWLEGGPELLTAGYAAPMTTSKQIIDSELVATDIAQVDDPLPALPPHLRYVAQTRLGPWLLHAFHFREFPPLRDTPIDVDLEHVLTVAANWLGDRVVVVEDTDTGGVAVVLDILREDPEDWTFGLASNMEERASDTWITTDLRITVIRAEDDATRHALTAAFAAPARSVPAPPPLSRVAQRPRR